MSERPVLDQDDLRRTLVRIAHEIIEKNAGTPRDDEGVPEDTFIRVSRPRLQDEVELRRLVEMQPDVLHQLPRAADLTDN